MDKAALLKKIRALAERGVGGEADNAEEILRRLMEKYGVSEDELNEEERRRHDFEYHGKEQEKLLRQVVFKVTGGYAYNLVYNATGRKVKTKLGADCTAAEKVEIESFLISIPDYGSGSGPRSYRPLFKNTGFSQFETT